MYSDDSDGLHMDAYLVGMHIDVQIEQYLALEIQLERKLGNRNGCILSKDHTEVRIFHLHRLIAAQIWNNFGGLWIGLKSFDFK